MRNIMAKSSLEKQIEKASKQQKLLADKKRKEEQKQARETAREAQKVATRERASSIVNNQSFADGFLIMDATAEEVLKCLLNCERSNENRVSYSNDIFPTYVQTSIDLEMEKQLQYGMITGLRPYGASGGWLNLLPQALTYFEDKKNAIERQKEKEKMSTGNINNYNNYGNMVFGNVSDSTLSVDNSIHQIEKDIEEHGGADKEVLKELLDDVKELIENIESSRSIPKQKKLHERLNEHIVKHGWFYGAVVQLLGTAVMNSLGA